MALDKKTIIITGASSGLGRALATKYAFKETRLFLFGRDKKRLEEVTAICKNYQAEVTTIICDVRDKEQVNIQLAEIIKSYKIDILITAAGVSAGTLGTPEAAEQVEEIFTTNLNGSLNFILPCMEQMIKNKSGTIVIISSMAGMLGLSSAPSYSASKAAVKIFGDALRGYLSQFNVQVCVAIPGYIDTPMTQVNKFPMPFKISANTAAQIIVNGINARKGLIIFPKLTYFMLKLLNLLPYRLVDYINSKLPGKPGFDEQ